MAVAAATSPSSSTTRPRDSAPTRRVHATTQYMSSMTREHGFEPTRVEGTLPDALRGTLYRVGPGLFENHGRRYSHPFEADGAVCAVRFNGDGAVSAHRVVQSAALVEERRAGKPLHGSVAPWLRRFVDGLRLKGKNSANTNVMVWQDRLFALYEVAKPTELTLDLDTIGEQELGCDVRAFSAHPHAVVSRGSIFNFGIRYGRHIELDLFELPARGPARKLASLPLPAPVMLHDFIATERHLIFFVAPARINRLRALLGVAKIEKLIQWSPQHGTEVIVVPIDDPTNPVRFNVDPFYQWHFAGAFERGDELFVDVVTYPNLGTLDELTDADNNDIEGGTLARVRVDTRARRLHHEPLTDPDCEFPRIDPRREGGDYGRVWLFHDFGGRSGLKQLDLDHAGVTRTLHHELPVGHRPSEPVFVPRSRDAAEGDGWVLSLVYDPERHESRLIVVDTQRFDDDPIAQVHLGHHVPMTFHGVWHEGQVS